MNYVSLLMGFSRVASIAEFLANILIIICAIRYLTKR